MVLFSEKTERFRQRITTGIPDRILQLHEMRQLKNPNFRSKYDNTTLNKS